MNQNRQMLYVKISFIVLVLGRRLTEKAEQEDVEGVKVGVVSLSVHFIS